MASSPPKLRTVITANERWVGLMGNDQGEKRISHLSYCWFLVVLCRLLNLKRTFEEKYGEAPLLYAYAPGRVNLIGEFEYLIEVSAVQWIKKKKLIHFQWKPPQCVCFFDLFPWNRGAYWLLRLLSSPHGHRAKHPGCRVAQQLRDNLTIQHKPSIQVRHCTFLICLF